MRTKRAGLNPWLGDERGYLVDWTTQQWVRRTGRVVSLSEHEWLAGPTAPPDRIGARYFERFAASAGMEVERDLPDAGLLASFDALRGSSFAPERVDSRIVDFYERTSRYRLQLWSQWSPVFRVGGNLIAAIFSRRLGQLQLPMAPLDTSRGVTSELLRLRAPDGAALTGWLRRRLPDGDVIYAGFYSVERPPSAPGPCVKVVFPLPNGSASIFLRPEARGDGSLVLISAGRRFGDAGFYFVVQESDDRVHVRHVAAMTESIHVYADDHGDLHTEHMLRLWGRVFLRLHYLMLPRRD